MSLKACSDMMQQKYSSAFILMNAILNLITQSSVNTPSPFLHTVAIIFLPKQKIMVSFCC